jgi:hypothetical protein
MTADIVDLGTPLRKRDSHLWARDPQDYYVEPEWCSVRLFEMEQFNGAIWDPACGMGRIVRAAEAAGYTAFGTDIVSRGQNLGRLDFMTCGPVDARNIVSNPPFRIAEKFVQKALAFATGKVAMLLPANWVQGDKRSRWLQNTRLRRVLFITPRPSMPPGLVIEAGLKPGNGTTDYAWFIWDGEHYGAPEIGWLRRD